MMIYPFYAAISFAFTAGVVLPDRHLRLQSARSPGVSFLTIITVDARGSCDSVQ